MVRESNHIVGRDGLLQALVGAIKAFQDAVGRFDAAVAAELGVNDTDLRCLTMLRDHGASQPSQLASAVGLSRSATTTALGRLEALGLVERRSHERDGRSYYVTLSPPAADRMEALWGPILEQGRLHLDSYTDEELRLLAAFMSRSETLHEDSRRTMPMVKCQGH